MSVKHKYVVANKSRYLQKLIWFAYPERGSYVASVPGPGGDTVAEVSILLNCGGDVRDKDVALAAVSKRQLWSDHTIKKKMNALLVTTQCLDLCTQAAVVHWQTWRMKGEWKAAFKKVTN